MWEGRDSPSARSGRGDEQTDACDPSSSGIFTSVVPGVVRRHYAAKFALSLLVVVVVIAVIGVGTYAHVQETIRGDATAKLKTTAELRSEAVAEWIDGMRSQTAIIGDPSRIDTAGNASVNTYLQSVKQRGAAAIVGVHYVKGDADLVAASTRASFRNATLAEVRQPWSDDEELFERAATDVAVTERSFRLDGEPALAFAASVGGGDYVVVTARPDEGVVAEEATGSIETYFLNRDGDAVFGPNGGRVHRLGDTEGFSGAQHGRTVTGNADAHVWAYTPVEETDWVAVSTARASSLDGVSDTIGLTIAALLLVSLVSLTAVGIVLGRWTVAPLADLRERTEAIEDGDLDVDLSTDREDEIGRLYAAFASMRDALRQQVRESKQARHTAESSRKETERQNRRLDQFASTLSHDLRNPLAVARGHVELLDTKLDDDQADLREHVEKIDGAHDRIDAIIDDVLTLTRKGESVEETERFGLRAVAEEAWRNIDSKDATLTVTDSLTIEGDRSRLLRALENLFRNSLDHGSDDVSVTVGLTEDGFYVQDDGPGIPDEEMGDIFEYGHTTSESGTGIGLSIVKTIAEAHGWSLWIDGTYENGARFVFADVFATEERIFEESAFTWDHDSQSTGD